MIVVHDVFCVCTSDHCLWAWFRDSGLLEIIWELQKQKNTENHTGNFVSNLMFSISFYNTLSHLLMHTQLVLLFRHAAKTICWNQAPKGRSYTPLKQQLFHRWIRINGCADRKHMETYRMLNCCNKWRKHWLIKQLPCYKSDRSSLSVLLSHYIDFHCKDLNNKFIQ